MKYKKGDTVYIIENNSKIRKVTIIGASAGFYTVRFSGVGLSAMRIREDRLYSTENDAAKTLGIQVHKEKPIRPVPFH